MSGMNPQHPAAPETGVWPKGRLVDHPQPGKVWVQIPHRNDIGSDWIEVDTTPAAPETETDANGLTEAERETLADEIRAANIPILMGWRTGWLRVLAEGLAPIVAERVRVVEGERDAWEAEAETLAVAAGNAYAYRTRAESAEAAHEAEKAAHERLRAGVWALGESIHGDEGVEHVEGCEGEPTCFACILDTLRSLLGGGEAR